LGPKLVPTCGALWGIYAHAVAGNWARGVTNLEHLVGRRFDLVKRYHDFSGTGGNGAFPDAYEKQLGADRNRILYFAWESRDYARGTKFAWRDIAAGRYDQTVLIPEARRIKAWGLPVFLDFDHEMDGSTRRGQGSPADYVAAYRHIHDVFAKQHVRNVVWVWTSTGTIADTARIAAMYPGDSYVDWVGYDPYNFYKCNGTKWKDPATTINRFYRWLESHHHGNKPFLLAEYGSSPDPADPAAKARWYADFVPALQALPNIKAVMQFDSASMSATKKCDVQITSGPGTLQAFTKAGHNPYVRVDIAP
jgi:hypothetical protein